MTLAPVCAIPAFMASKELLAELTSKPKTSAVRVASIPAPNFTVTFELLSRWCCGKTFCSNMPSSTPPKMHPALMKPIVREFMSGLAARHILNSVMLIASGFGVVLKRGDPFVAGVVVYSIEFLSKHCAIEYAVCADPQKQDKVDGGATKAFQKNSLWT